MKKLGVRRGADLIGIVIGAVRDSCRRVDRWDRLPKVTEHEGWMQDE
jgi:hypothetical protein